MKLGDHTIVLVKVTDHPTATDAYGNPVKVRAYREVRWCLVTPARSSEDSDRKTPAIVGSNLLAPRATFDDVLAADEILWPWTVTELDGSPVYAGTRWEILGEVGRWDEAIEAQLRRLT